MKRANHLLPQIQSLDNLYLAFWKAQRGHRHKKSVEKFRQNLDEELEKILVTLQSGYLDVGNYHYFKIHDPKERLICACSFPEKVLHHALMNVCHEIFERYQIFDSYASRKGKGTHAAVIRGAYFSSKYRCFVKLDVKAYFETLNHEVLLRQLARQFKEPLLLSYFEQVITSYETNMGQGLPIGNLTSQYFANHFLGEADHFLKNQLRVKGYVRYMDDMILWHNDKKVLKASLRAFTNFIEDKLYCTLKPPILNDVQYGISFLGYRLTHEGIELSRRTKQRMLKQFRYPLDIPKAQALIAISEHAMAKKFRRMLFLL